MGGSTSNVLGSIAYEGAVGGTIGAATGGVFHGIGSAIRRFSSAGALEAKLASRTMTKAEWKAYYRAARLAGAPNRVTSLVDDASGRFARRLSERGINNAQDFLARSIQRGTLSVDDATAVLRANGQFRAAKVAQRVYRKALTSTDTMVIGSLRDTGIAARWPGHRVLTMRNRDWNLVSNAAWVRGGIDRGATFYRASPINLSTMTHPIFGQTVFAREIAQLNSSGYRHVGDYIMRASQ